MEHNDGFLPSVTVVSNSISGWYHIALTYSNGLPRLYLDGVLARNGLSSGKSVHPSYDLAGTVNSGGLDYGRFRGDLQEVRLWNVPLSSATLQAWMNPALTTNHPAYANLRGYWPLVEGQ